MVTFRIRQLTVVAAIAAAALVDVSPARSQTDSASRLQLGGGLKAAFTPLRTTRYRGTMKPGARGIVSQSFLNLNGAGATIELAFVLDATNSMGNDLENLRNSLTDVIDGVRKQVTTVDTDNVRVKVAVVVYRDLLGEGIANDPRQRLRASPVEVFPSRDFADFNDEDERKGLFDFLAGLKAETGTPYFEEQVDRGLDRAINLDWALDPAVTRVIVLAGDAPPFPEELIDSNSPLLKSPYEYWGKWCAFDKTLPTLRSFKTSDLIARAVEKKIVIHAVRCDTSVTDQTVIDTYLPQAKQFFTKVAEETGGGLLDLRDQNIVGRLVDVASGRVASLIELKSFKAEDLERLTVRHQVADGDSKKNVEPVKVAFLPLLPLDKLDYGRGQWGNPAYLVASTLARSVREQDATLAFTGDEVRRAWGDVRKDVPDLKPEQAIPALVQKLGADFVVWGNLDAAASTAEINIVDASGKSIATQSVTDVSADDIRTLWDTVSSTIRKAGESGNDDAVRFVSLSRDVTADAAFKDVTENPASLATLNEAYEQLEQAAGYPHGTLQSQELSKQAQNALNGLVVEEPENAVAWMLLASCAVNLDQAVEVPRCLQKARETSASLAGEHVLRLEIEGDYQLHVAKEPALAIKQYEKLLAGVPELSKTALRAHWMLAGMHLGDWGINPGKLYGAEGLSMQICQDAAQRHILTIVASWPDSPEARFYGRYIDPPIAAPRRADPNAGSDAVVAQQIEYQIHVPANRPSAVTTALLDFPVPPETN